MFSFLEKIQYKIKNEYTIAISFTITIKFEGIDEGSQFIMNCNYKLEVLDKIDSTFKDLNILNQ